ncbi:uncharacterized protein LOC113234215 isoform X2 [Hyposmocoma kahamanoa]|uniref:uncharacterized protein LOC113234215 isoform X2 n=1 Tax=Hyposmocoma kahamanoa TaxID=1477025 RepID=UPI000E6D987F|nr:uncharacterized protein LOC113234215 isoform X2 [Hyposmocoma kahamanoa]
MLKGRTRDPRTAGQLPPHLASRPPMKATIQTRSAQPTRAPLAKPEPDYEVVEFPTDQYVNAKLQPPPPPPPRPATNQPVDAGASCGLCGGGGARVRCTECGRRALCASCDDMYHRHPKRRNHQRLALSPSQLRDERPPLPPKTTPPVPPPRRHKLAGDRSSASPMPPGLDQRRATVGHVPTMPSHSMHLQMSSVNSHLTQQQALPSNLQGKPHSFHAAPPTQAVHAHVGSMPYLPAPPQAPPLHMHANTLHHNMPGLWGRMRGSLQGFNVPSTMGMPSEPWESPGSISPSGPSSSWGPPLRRNASVLELGGGTACSGCAHCSPASWRYGSCASLEHGWPPAWPPPPTCCAPPHGPHLSHMHPHTHFHSPHTSQPYRRGESRGASRVASRTGSRAASPAMSARSRTSRRTKHRTPSPPPLPSSDADSESESDSDRAAMPAPVVRTPTREPGRAISTPKPPVATGPLPTPTPPSTVDQMEEDSLGPAPPPSETNWQCEHCTFVNEPGVRVCSVCCRTPTTAPRVLPTATAVAATVDSTVTIAPVKSDPSPGLERLKLSSPSPVRIVPENINPKQNAENTKTKPVKSRASTSCGPSPPREALQRPINRLMTPTGDQTGREQVEEPKTRHDMAVGPSPPRDFQNTRHNMGTGTSSPRESNAFVRSSPYREPNVIKSPDESTPRHSVSLGPSPPRDLGFQSSRNNTLKKSSPPRATFQENKSSVSTRTNVSNTGTSPPPQSISTQTYEVPNSWERVPSASRSRPQRRFRDDSRRERSHSRHSLSSDTRDSERSVHTSGGGRWEWRETRDSSPGGEWSGSERRRGAARLARRASHLDLRRTRSMRRSSFYGSEAASPEPLSSNRAISLEALAGTGVRREAERGLELARLMTDAERLGFSAAEVHAALAQNPVAPLAWLRDRWPSLCAGVRAAAARLAPGVNVSELEARAALARHRGAMWPAVTDCVERHRRQAEAMGVGEERRLRGHIWGSPVGADDDAAPPPTKPSVARRSLRAREDSSDEFEAPIPTKYRDDDWMYLPLDPPIQNSYDMEPSADLWNDSHTNVLNENSANNTEDIALKLKSYLIQAGVPSIDENLLLNGLLADNTTFKTNQTNNVSILNHSNIFNNKQQLDLGQSEFDFIEAYNALTRSSPLPNVHKMTNDLQTNKENVALGHKEHTNLPLKSNKNGSSNEDKIINHIHGQTEDHPVESKVERTDISEEHSIIATIKIPKSLTKQNSTVETKETVSTPITAREYETKGSKPVLLTKLQKYKVPRTHEINTRSLNSETLPKQKNNEEGSNNLSDIVDNTQRLIQQMKDEINSDINSLDGHNMSQSEADNSSNESDFTNEHESSYSETEEETEDLTSEENENSRSEKSENNAPVMNRTSSEDNEQFEEAMDHIEEQNENFRQTNMEILDSIARSLHEEHSISVETSENHIKEAINDPSTPTEHLAPMTTQTIPVQNQATSSKKHKQDVNNNIFAAVSSFEEIYEQINSNDSTPFEITNNSLRASKPKLVLERFDIHISTFMPDRIMQLEIKEQHQPSVLNAVFENVDSSTTLPNNIELPNNVEEVSEVDQHVDNNNKESGLSMKSKTFNIRSSPDKIESTDDDDSSSDTSRTTVSPMKQNLNQTLIIDKTFSNENTNETVETTPLNGSLNNQNHDFDHNIESSVTNNAVKSKSNSPDNTPPSPKNHNKNTTNNKSNIPKLIRALANKNKSKQEIKSPPKVIASKVPVRRGSVKHYPAPAPPKTNFGTIQNGTVKQLQTRLFSDKAIKMTVNHAAVIEVKPSTSTLNKKRPAPLPPSKPEETTKTSPPKESPQKGKKPYFRESCRTEDEWTESDSEDSPLQIGRQNNDEPQRQPSPPPPITVRRVSGQLIDLARVRILEGSPERQARMLLAEGATENWEQAQLAVELIARGADTPAALLAALECIDLNSALTYLHQDCELCASRLPEHEMVSMLRCTHRCCRECARHYFTVQITERSVVDCVCPYCKEPELENLPEDAWLEYFAHLDIQLKTLIDIDTHELFQRKLRDRTLARDPNFRWCVECSSGFFVHPKQKKLRCPECKSVTCASCRKPWTGNHEGLSCEQYAKWLDDNDPERAVEAVQQHLRENGIECPRCQFKYSLSRGGCMHFTCTQCKYEFCYGCGKPFMMGARCGLSEYCAKLGLHAHHPRNCLFYLRDKEPHELQTLLQMNNVKYETETAEGNARCPVQLQRETPTGLVDTTCGSEVPPNYAGLCKNHYLEYLCRLVRNAHVDPMPLLEGALCGVSCELGARPRPYPHHGRARAGSRAASPRSDSAGTRALGH